MTRRRRDYEPSEEALHDMRGLSQEIRILKACEADDSMPFQLEGMNDQQSAAVAAAYATFLHFANEYDLDTEERADASVSFLQLVTGIDSPFIIIAANQALSPHRDTPVEAVQQWMDSPSTVQWLAEAAEKELLDPAGYATDEQKNHWKSLVAKADKKN